MIFLPCPWRKEDVKKLMTFRVVCPIPMSTLSRRIATACLSMRFPRTREINENHKVLSLLSFLFQETLCTTKTDLECVQNQTGFKNQFATCFKRCNGLIVSSFTETKEDRKAFFKKFANLLRNYSGYRGEDLSPKSKLNQVKP